MPQLHRSKASLYLNHLCSRQERRVALVALEYQISRSQQTPEGKQGMSGQPVMASQDKASLQEIAAQGALHSQRVKSPLAVASV